MPSLRHRRERTAARESQAYTENSWAETFRPVIFIPVIDNGMGFAIIEVRPDKRNSRGLTPVPLNERPESRSDRKIDPCWQLSARAALLRRLALHYYQFHIADFSLHTSHLTLEEEAVFRRLLDHYYDTESPIPKETQPVIRRLRLVSYAEIVQSILSEFFVLQDDGWHNLRADSEISDYNEKAVIARENGKKGGRPKKNKRLQNEKPRITQPVILANPDVTQPKPNQEPITINEEPLTNNHKPSNSPNGVAVIGVAVIGFDEFYEAYPKKVGRDDALRAWKKLKPDQDLITHIMWDIDQRVRLGAWCTGKGKAFIPGPAPYLNQKKWRDEIIPRPEFKPPQDFSAIAREAEIL